MLHTDFEMLYQIDSIDDNGFVSCDIGGATFGTGDGTDECPINADAEPSVSLYALVREK